MLTGSHAGTQPTGGRYDGICGVLGGLEVVRALNDAGVETARPIDVVVWTHEEGTRFAPPMIASGVLAGVYSLDYGLSLAEAAGVTLGGALAQIGHAGDAPVGGAPLPAAFDRAVAAAPHAPRPMRVTAPSGAIPARMRRRARHSPQLNRRLQQSSQTDSNNCDMLSYYE
ncbi:M20/M25/M40 family metallo-hydrolase [Burkholderia pseudomallei]|nr:M20/M25/M40 family metallo-hydrolase [Burkholderia pseudomallei]QRM24952.1 M20/M25/M40 family metallo-hydrolase [Burkholderia pseudomallei]